MSRASWAPSSPENGQVRLINSDALQTALPYAIVNGYLGALSTDPPQTGEFEPVQPPESQ